MHLTFSVEIYDTNTKDLFFLIFYDTSQTIQKIPTLLWCYALYLMFSSTTYIVKKGVKYL